MGGQGGDVGRKLLLLNLKPTIFGCNKPSIFKYLTLDFPSQGILG